MKKIRILIIIIILLLIIFIYAKSFNKYGNNQYTEVNNPSSILISEKPRLEDDFYSYVNYEYLSKDNLEDELFNYYTIQEKKIEEEKELIINELMKKDNSISRKINSLYTSYMESNKEDSLNELNTYINKINNSNDINEFFKNSIDINYELNTDILISPNVLFNPKGESKKYFGFDLITYDMDNTIGYYSITGYDSIIRMYKKYDIQILKEYGYTPQEAIKITDDVQKMYEVISRFSEIDQNKLLEDGFKIYSFEELQNQLNNIKLDYILKYYSEFYEESDGIVVTDINQLKLIDEFLKEDNLETLKEYATLKILSTYAPYISETFYEIYKNYMYENNHYIIKEDYTKEEIGYAQIYQFFKDTITEEFSKKHFSNEQKEFYTKLIEEEIKVYIERINNEKWLSNETKQKAIKKMQNMTFTVGLQDNLVKVENAYNINSTKSYISNIINIRKNTKIEEMRQYKKNNITYNNEQFDQLTVNAFYLPNNNSINILLGYIYSLTETLELGDKELEENYYKILGSIGTTIGHELSHSLDTMGSKYDEYGNYINWWTEDDEYNFNCLTSKVVKYYENFEQFGNTTLGENIADLGGMSIILEIAQDKNATDDDFKEIFYTYAQNYASQYTTTMREYLLNKDEHSPNKNRVNAVISTFDKFYQIFNIIDTDEMYISKENRVSVW